VQQSESMPAGDIDTVMATLSHVLLLCTAALFSLFERRHHIRHKHTTPRVAAAAASRVTPSLCSIMLLVCFIHLLFNTSRAISRGKNRLTFVHPLFADSGGQDTVTHRNIVTV
jgi:hypothetical protein